MQGLSKILIVVLILSCGCAGKEKGKKLKFMWGLSHCLDINEIYHWSNNMTLDERLSRMVYDFKELGITWFRPHIIWNDVEPVITNVNLAVGDITDEMVEYYAFQDPTKYWEKYDKLIAKMEEARVNLFMVLCAAYTSELPKYYAGDGQFKPILPDNIGKENYLGHVYLHTRATVRRYKEWVHYWQTENELDVADLTASLPPSWRNGDCWSDFEFLKELLKTMYKGVKEEDPAAWTAMNFVATDPRWRNRVLDWIDYIDIIGVDAYPNYITSTPVKGGYLGDKIREAVELNTGKPVVVLETGYPSGPEERGYNEENQAIYVNDAPISALENGADGFFYFKLTSPEVYENPNDAIAVECCWGLIRPDNSYKPAWFAYKQVIESH